nr:MAG TPA: hypothetical protein [Caudoviricetes sp.]
MLHSAILHIALCRFSVTESLYFCAYPPADGKIKALPQFSVTFSVTPFFVEIPRILKTMVMYKIY